MSDEETSDKDTIPVGHPVREQAGMPNLFSLAMTLSRIEGTLASMVRRQELAEAGDIHQLEQVSNISSEIKRMMREFVDFRSAFAAHVSDPHAHANAIRAPAASFTTEVKATHDSIRAMADAQTVLLDETAKQTPMIKQTLENALKSATDAAMAAQDAAKAATRAASGQALTEKTNRDQKLTALAIAFAALFAFLSQMLHK